MTTDDGGAAYPHGPYERNALRDDGTLVTEMNLGGPGMTLLDHYIGIAWGRMIEADLRKDFDDRDTPEKLAKAAYIAARAVIEAKQQREKEM